LFVNLFSTASKNSSMSSSIFCVCITIACGTKNIAVSGTKTCLVCFTRYALPPPHVHYKLLHTHIIAANGHRILPESSK
jgi:hypothetical protein